jgi:hypothetical protein
MLPERQSTTRESDIVRATNECLNTYHTEESDISSSTMRTTFCGCFAKGIVEMEAFVTDPVGDYEHQKYVHGIMRKDSGGNRCGTGAERVRGRRKNIV